jgi:hypothetical protein
LQHTNKAGSRRELWWGACYTRPPDNDTNRKHRNFGRQLGKVGHWHGRTVAGRVETLADVMLLTKGDMAAVSVCAVVLSSLLSSLPPSLDDTDGEPTCVLLTDEDGDKDNPVAKSLRVDDGDDPSVDCGGTEVDRVALPLSLAEYGDANGDADAAP